MPPRRVILESPYQGDVKTNTKYARLCLRDSLLRGEAPLASHLLYTQPHVLDDLEPDERARGIKAGLAWGIEAEATVVYTDRGITDGMLQGIDAAREAGRPCEMRKMDGYVFEEEPQYAGVPETILEEAQRVVAGPRQDNYGHPLDNFTRIALTWEAILGYPVTAQQVGLCMIGVKLCRQSNRSSRDNLVDVAGYAAALQLAEDEQVRRNA